MPIIDSGTDYTPAERYVMNAVMAELDRAVLKRHPGKGASWFIDYEPRFKEELWPKMTAAQRSICQGVLDLLSHLDE